MNKFLSMKILHILDSLNRGGAEMLALDLCRNARACGLDLILVATGGGELEDQFRRSGVEFIRLTRRLPVDPLVVARLRSIIRRRDVRVVHGYQAVDGLHAYLATLGTRVKKVLSFHGYAPDAKNRRALKFLAPRMDANVAVSKDFLNTLRTVEGLDTSRNFQVIYNGVDAARLRPGGNDSRNSIRAGLDLSPGDLLLGMVGNFYADARKDQLTVCKALPALFTRVPRARFAFVGGWQGAGQQMYDDCQTFCAQHAIANRVHFLGQRTDIPDVLAALDVFVFSTIRDTFGIALVEAMMVGLPVAASDIAPVREVTDEGRYAALFRTGDADDLARILIELADDPARRTELAARGREWATSRFGIAQHVARLRELYDSLAGVP
jgi:glycosyltransferase involved in cell wall biosynthesis